MRDYAKDQRTYRRKLRLDALLELGGKCVKCGFSDSRALQINHINGGGRQERIKDNGSWKIYRDARDGKRKDLEILCANCNCIHRIDRSLGYRGGIVDNKSLNTLVYIGE